MESKNAMVKLGAIFYIIWGLLHFQAAYSVYQLGLTMTRFSMEQGRVYQDAWNLFFFAVAAIYTAIALNWHNSRLGFWINFAVVSVADLGFILFILLPGAVGVWPGVLGPAFWILGLVFTATGLRRTS